jgi:hypothetical protein
LALDGDKPIRCLVSCTFALRDSSDRRSLVENLVNLERLVLLGEVLGGFQVTLDVDGEEVGGIFFANNTTIVGDVRELNQLLVF